ncbi:phosphoadenosine phosphosulfate reductase family protein [Flagellimonas sp.]|uniref:phosphoadenosine phosphosulfate reductase domain-containing protein n=1 Tax=Flagellimonas sp. TaxID=2058762 RepID=UPI003BAC01D6
MIDYTDKLKWSETLAERIKKDYNPYAVIVGLTTGFDSNVALKLATMFFNVDAAFTCDTTIAAPETLANCERVAKEVYGLKWICKAPPYNGKRENHNTYFEVVKQHGFPGKTKTAHNWMYRWLKDHTVSRIISDIRKKKRNRPIIIVSGARKYESVRRMGTSQDVTVIGNNIWVNICNEWTNSEVHAFAEDNKLSKYRSPISQILGISGECFCGCFSQKGELSEIKFASPSAYEKLSFISKWLSDNTNYYWGWEEGPSKQWTLEKYGQINMFSESNLIMCSTCMNNTDVLQ